MRPTSQLSICFIIALIHFITVLTLLTLIWNANRTVPPLIMKTEFWIRKNDKIYSILQLLNSSRKNHTAQNMKFSIKDFFRKLRIWSHLLKKSLMKNFIFLCGVNIFKDFSSGIWGWRFSWHFRKVWRFWGSFSYKNLWCSRSWQKSKPNHWVGLLLNYWQKQSSASVLKKRHSENIQQIYRRTPMPNCDFNKVSKHLYWNHTSALVFYCKFAEYFQNTRQFQFVNIPQSTF